MQRLLIVSRKILKAHVQSIKIRNIRPVPTIYNNLVEIRSESQIDHELENRRQLRPRRQDINYKV